MGDAAAMLASVSLRCLIVDDNASFLKASRALLEAQGVSVVGVATTAAEGLRRAAEVDHDVVLVDIDLGDDNGFELARELVNGERQTGSKVILISTHPEDEFADLIVESPALGFLPKPDLSRRSIERVLSG